jgi:hypothetical protein
MRELLLAAAGVGALAAWTLAAAWVHHGYAWRNYRATVAAVTPARRVWLSRLGKLIAMVVVFGALLWLLGTGPQR